MNKDPDIVPEEAPKIILHSKYAVCMDNKDTDTEHTNHIDKIVHMVRMAKNEKFTRLTGVKEVWNCQTLKLWMLLRIT